MNYQVQLLNKKQEGGSSRCESWSFAIRDRWSIMQNKKACHPSTLARKATRTLRLDFFFELILKINNPQLRLATTWPLHSGRP